MRPLKIDRGSTSRCGRRELVGGSLALFAAGCSAGASSGSFGEVSAGNASALAVGSIRVLPGVAGCIARDAGGVYAMTLICTHQGCDIATQGNVSASGIQCGCHGSAFDVDGNVVHGPAASPLDHLAVTADSAGNLTVNGGVVVSSSTRLSV